LCYANEYIDTYEIRRYIKCYCLDCGKLIEDRDYNFKDTKIIKTTLSYYVVQQLYSNFIKDYDTSDYEKIYCDFKNRIIDKEKEDKVYKFK